MSIWSKISEKISGAKGALDKAFAGDNRTIEKMQPLVKQINDFEIEIKALTNDQLKDKTAEFKARLAGGGEGGAKAQTLDDILPEAFAVVREAAFRTLGQRHFDVQLLGGIVLHRGGIAEMRTGEGKTLVATLPAYLNAITGKGVHVVTVNDYLSRRDAAWMGQIYNFLGLSVGVMNSEASYLYDPTHSERDADRDQKGFFKVVHEFLRPCTRADAYAADITYGTNNEYGFDYLRDNIVYEKKNLVQREHAYAIVDEIDSILIDEARTPLIISAPAAESEDLYKKLAKIVGRMDPATHYEVDEKLRAITITPAGIEYAEKQLGIDNLYTEGNVKLVHHLETAVKARALYHREKEYVVKDGEVIIVDEFTGRLQPGRRWSEGLHQAVEAKEGVSVQRESRTFASITFQNYFRMYGKLSGMTGTGLTSKEEFFKVYGLEVISIPTNKPIARKDHNDFIFQTEQGKFKAIAAQVAELHKKGQPVLVGTVSIEKNELLSQYFKAQGVPHKVLNAKPQYAEKEGEIVAEAGRRGAVTIATNMAGRGVDIKLGGPNATLEQYEEIKNLGGLFVLGTERHEARRIDNQLRGRAGRQGDPGETQFFASLEDPLMRVFASDTVKRLMGTFNIPEDEAIENFMINRALESAQTKIEGFHFDSRKQVLEYDDVLNHQRKTVYARRRTLLVGSEEEVRERMSEGVALLKSSEAHAEVGNQLENLIKDKAASLGEAAVIDYFRKLALQVNDMFWMDHLETMDELRNSVRLRSYGQRDPLVEYKREGLILFKKMEEGVRLTTMNVFYRGLAGVSGTIV